jgi:hypothetical protein
MTLRQLGLALGLSLAAGCSSGNGAQQSTDSGSADSGLA